MKKVIGIAIFTLALTLLLAIIEPKFLSAFNLQNLTRFIAFLSILALGEGLVILSGGIDLSVGAIAGCSALLVAYLAGPHPLPVWLAALNGGDQMPIAIAILLVLTLMLGVGALQGRMITRLGLQPFIVTLGGMMILRGMANVATQGAAVGLGNDHDAFRALGSGVVAGILPVPVLLMIVIAAVAYMALHHTILGQYLYAIGRNEEAARFSGIDIRRWKAVAYLGSAGLAATTGILYASYLPSVQPNFGTAYELYAIAAAVLGGCSLRGGEGTVVGILVGATLMRLITNGINLLGINTHWEYAVIGSVIVVAAILDAFVAKRGAKRAPA